VATDVDPGLVAPSRLPALEVVRHDLVAEPLPPGPFDLVHARMVIQHLPSPDAVLERLCGVLRPGGWIIVEDSDWSSLLATPAPSPLLRSLRQALATTMQSSGFDPACGLKHLGRLRHLGLSDVTAEGRAVVMTGGSDGAVWYRLWITRLRRQLVDSGLLTGSDVDAALAVIRDPGQWWLSQVLVATRGRAAGS
jgi:SAM-dependent methyltransferase